jgi:hypothetical protein
MTTRCQQKIYFLQELNVCEQNSAFILESHFFLNTYIFFIENVQNYELKNKTRSFRCLRVRILFLQIVCLVMTIKK